MTGVLPDAASVPASGVERSSTGLSTRAASVLCYTAACVTGLLMLAIERDSRVVRFHAWQATLGLGLLVALPLACWGLTILMAFVSASAFRMMAWVTQGAWLLLAVAWVVAMAQAARGRSWRMPLVVRLAERLAARQAGRRPAAASQGPV